MLVSFDLNGTLLNSGNSIKWDRLALYKKWGFQIEEKEFLIAHQATKKQLSENAQIIELGVRDTLKFWIQKELLFLKQEEKKISIADINTIAEKYKTDINSQLEIFQRLKRRKHIVAIISNNIGNSKTIIEQCDLHQFVDVVIDSSVVGIVKPDKAIFHLCMKHFNINNHSDCWHIGDNFDQDIIGAENAGWNAIYFTDKPKQKYYREITNLKQIFKWIP